MVKSQIYTALNSFAKVELEDIKHFFGAEVPYGAKKAEYVDKISAFIIDNPEKWLSRMLERDLMLLGKLVKLGPGVSYYADYPDYPTVLETVKLIDSDTSDPNFRKLSISEELYSIVSPCIGKVIHKCKKNGTFKMEQIALGILNIYGVIPFEEFVRMMWENTAEFFEDNENEWNRFLEKIYSMPIVSISIHEEQGTKFLFSPCLSDPGKILYQRGEKEFDKVKSVKVYKKSRLLEAGKHAPFFISGLGTKEGIEVRDILRTLGYSEDDIIREMHDMWINSQTVTEDASTEALLSSINRKQDEISSFEKYTEYMKAVARYANSLPKWLLCGHTSDEMDLMKVVLQVDSDQDRALDPVDMEDVPSFDLPEPTISEGFGNLGLDMLKMFVPHVAKTDPCPCGSGLLYKNCHGKNLS
ncbi:MAG: SEC-C domain-containing protein [Bacteroidales bacterium]|nr:SEC-C domain-containing protein [Bacteroidales bacterium]